MTFVEIAKPNWFERLVVLLVQAIFFVTFFLLYLLSPRTAHRLVGYFEEQAVISYTLYLTEIDEGRVANIPAPEIAIAYWNLAAGARLREVVIAVRDDEMGHRDVNHEFADVLNASGIEAALVLGGRAAAVPPGGCAVCRAAHFELGAMASGQEYL